MSKMKLDKNVGIEITKINSNRFKYYFREERHYCNHLFRLLCYRKEDGGRESGLGQFLSIIDLPLEINRNTIKAAEVYTEVAILRDYYKGIDNKHGFLKKLFELITATDKSIKELRPTPISKILPLLDKIHPRDFPRSNHCHGSEDDKLFYGKFASLFSVKPDFLIICDNRMIWLEAKLTQSFSRSQLKRMKLLADICSSDIFYEVFRKQSNMILAVGTSHHKNIRKEEKFIRWAEIASIASRILPYGADNYTASTLAMLDND